MPHNSVLYHGLHCLLKSKQSSGTEKPHYKAMLIGHPFKYKMYYVIRLVSNFTWKLIGMNRVKIEQDVCGKTTKCFIRVRVIFIFVLILTSIKSVHDKSRVT